MKKFKYSILIFSLLLLSACDNFKACIAEEFMQNKVSDGGLLLSIQHLSLMVNEVNKKDKPYSFDNAPYKIEKSAALGRGIVTWTIENQSIIYPHEEVVYTDCNGREGLMQGGFKIIEAKRIMEGILTGDEKNPVIPDHDKIRMEIRAKVENLTVQFRPKFPAYLKLKSGEISFIAKPRLAQSNDAKMKGLRVAPTANLTLENVKLEVKAKLFSQDINMDIPINDSNFRVQIGLSEHGEENKIEGWIKTFGLKRKAPSVGNSLDPEYDRQKFIDTYLCTLKGPLLYGDSKGFFAANLARLLVLNAANLTFLASKKMQEPLNFIRNHKLENNMTRLSLTAKRNSPFKAESVTGLNKPVLVDCLGDKIFVHGKVLAFNAKMIRDGVRINPSKSFTIPYVTEGLDYIKEALSAWWNKRDEIFVRPNKPESTKLFMSATLEDFYAMKIDKGKKEPEAYLEIKSGKFYVEANPILGQDKRINDEQGPSFSIETPIIKFDQIRVLNAVVILRSQGMEVPFFIKSANLEAFNGFYKGEGNYIKGDMKFTSILALTDIPADLGDVVEINEELVPPHIGYNQDRFNESYRTCTPNLLEIISPN